MFQKIALISFSCLDLLGSPSKEQKPASELIHSGTLESGASFERSGLTDGGGDTATDLFAPSSSSGMVLFIQVPWNTCNFTCFATDC